MPSIGELFTTSEVDGEGVDPDLSFDIDTLLSETDRALSESTRLRVPELQGQDGGTEGGEPVPLDVAPQADPSGEAPEEREEPVVREASESGGVTEPTTGGAPDPLGLLPPERRAALLAMDEVIQGDPAKRDRVLRALADEPTPESTWTPPQRPEFIEDDTAEAVLWDQNVATQRAVAQIGERTQRQEAVLAQQQANVAAERAGQNFEARYEGKLTHDDVVEIARHAGQSGLAARFTTGASDLTSGFTEALETALWTNERFRDKVIGEAAPKVEPANTTESKDRKRKLTAVSSSASPTSGPPTAKTPLETRVDGRLTPGSRLSVVKEMATQLSQANNQGAF